MPYNKKGQYLFPLPWKFQQPQPHVRATAMQYRMTTHTFGARAFDQPQEADVVDRKGKRRRVVYKARLPWGRKRTRLILTNGEMIVVKHIKDLPQIA